MNKERLFAEIERWYGNEKCAVGPSEDLSKFEHAESKGGKDCPLGCGPPPVTGFTFKGLDWAQRQCNKRAWKEIMEASRGAVTNDPFAEDAVKENFQFLDLYFSISVTASMNKTRLHGWTGFSDTLEAAFEPVKEIFGMGLLPPVVADAARPLV
ncbi:hypothetical protein P171DRAFT_479984 [Karstenula rhodostoma CBS 690.94]|uniref:Uncharacterized protein n=1 Tax=Karstenula rhodostoma CBS 690.94 TaxID=1392251 RepID=A0A9P4PV99_9PLEO|nr:hypothetical protein P171DRAFT_479984 [Karstenula rhodostoma CBS 690.94]